MEKIGGSLDDENDFLDIRHEKNQLLLSIEKSQRMKLPDEVKLLLSSKNFSKNQRTFIKDFYVQLSHGFNEELLINDHPELTSQLVSIRSKYYPSESFFVVNKLVGVKGFEKVFEQSYLKKTSLTLIKLKQLKNNLSITSLRKYISHLIDSDPAYVFSFISDFDDLCSCSDIINKKAIIYSGYLFSKYPALPDKKEYNYLNKIIDEIYAIESIKIGKRNVTLDWNVNILNGLFITFIENRSKYEQGENIDWNDVVKEYEGNLQEYIQQGEVFTKENTLVFNIIDDADYVFARHATTLEKTLKSTVNEGAYISYSSREGTLHSPKKILKKIKKILSKDDMHKNVFIHFGLHGSKDGTASYEGGTRSKKDFDKLFTLRSNKQGTVTSIFVESCFSGFKDDNFNDNTTTISLSSDKKVGIIGVNTIGNKSRGAIGSIDTFLKAFLVEDGVLLGDFNGDGKVNFHEAILYRNLYYNKSLTPTWLNEDGKTIKIATSEQGRISKDRS